MFYENVTGIFVFVTGEMYVLKKGKQKDIDFRVFGVFLLEIELYPKK